MVLSTLLWTIVSIQSAFHSPVPMVRALESIGFVVRQTPSDNSANSGQAFLRRETVWINAVRDDDFFSIRAISTRSPADGEQEEQFYKWALNYMAGPARFDETKPLSSGFPLGQRFQVTRSGGEDPSFSVSAYSDVVFLYISGAARKRTKDEHGVWHQSPQPPYSLELLECVARWQMGTLEALVGEPKNFEIGGKSLKGLQIGEHSFVSGEALCKAKGWEPLVHEMSAQLRFTTPKGRVVVPLASPEVQLGGARLKYGGITVADGYDIYVPLGLAQALW